MSLCFHGEVILPEGTIPKGYLLCADGEIKSVGTTRPSGVEVVEGRYVAPGYIDIHVHGGGGADYMDGTAEAVRTANRSHARHGTTTIFPTTIFGPMPKAKMRCSAMVCCTLFSVRCGASVRGNRSMKSRMRTGPPG